MEGEYFSELLNDDLLSDFEIEYDIHEEVDESGDDYSVEVHPRGAPLGQEQPQQEVEASREQPVPADLQGIDRTFTIQEEVAEINSMTVSEMKSIEEDLLGITSGLSNLGIRGPTPDLKGLEYELSRLPPEQTAAYAQAMTECPGLVSDKRKMAFLEREGNNPALAAARLATYWESRLEVFGPERCFLPMTLSGAMRDEGVNMVRRPIFQLLPVRDTAGRAILLYDPSRRNLTEYSCDQEMMAFWYLVEVATEDPEVQSCGVVFVINAKSLEKKHLSRTFSRFLSSFMSKAFPTRTRAIHICNPNLITTVCIIPAVKLFMGRENRRRLPIHSGSTAEVLKSLEGYGLLKDRLPAEVGGKILLDMAKWVSDRRALEDSRPDPRLVSEEERIIVPDGPAAKRTRCEPTLPVSQEAVPATQQKRKGAGRPSDPKMVKAIEARLADPDSALLDILLMAGFSFHTNDAGEKVDDENVTLAQRKNNLCRRVRQEKLKRAAEGTSTAEAQPNNVQDSTNANNLLSGAAVSGGDVPMEASVVERSGNTSNNAEGDNDESGSVCSRDSFYDSILQLVA